MKKNDKPSEYFIGAILRGYDTEAKNGEATCSGIWNHIVIECLQHTGAFETMFQWDTSKAQKKNRIGTIAECIKRGYVPGLQLGYNDEQREVVVPTEHKA